MGYGARRYANGPLVVDCFAREDLSRIAADTYGDDPECEEEVERALTAEPVEGCIVDRSGILAPVRVMRVENFWLLKLVRANRDRTRGHDERDLDADHADAAMALMQVIYPPSSKIFSWAGEQEERFCNSESA